MYKYFCKFVFVLCIVSINFIIIIIRVSVADDQPPVAVCGGREGAAGLRVPYLGPVVQAHGVSGK